MSPEESIVTAAARLSDPERRRAYVESACAGDADLLRRVNALMAANDTMASTSGEGGEGPADLVDGRVRVGRYKLLQKIGEGGGGVVYMAEQEEPVRRRVALKVLKPGMDTRVVVARFEAERQALALMDHPHIARVLDGGATETGRPFFVMELVRGNPITEYCDQHQLGTERRLDLMIRVCSAIQHAHQKGIIHRDIKPSNILITLHDGVPVPKVIDFGIAKALDQRLTDKTLFTRFEQFVGTPAYMSPEQAEMSGMDVDTRSDIYSLGVVLYELLTGQTPFDPRALAHSGIDALRRTLREVDPVRPSAKVATLQDLELTTAAKRRSVEPPRLVRELRGDLDWIVMRCLEKDRARRYETANGLAMDLARYLANEPVVARPPSAGYRFRKWSARNRVLFASGSAVAVSLMLGLGTSLWLYGQERAARGRARVAAARSDQVARFLGEMLSGVGPSVAQGRDTTLLREILQRSSERIGEELKEQPEVEAALRRTLGQVQAELGEYQGAEASFRRLIELNRRLHGDAHPAVATAMMELGGVFDRRGGEWARAEAQYREALALRRRLLGGEHADTLESLQALVAMLNTQQKWAEGETACREALALARRLHGPRTERVRFLLGFLRWNLQGQGRLRDAEQTIRDELDLLRELAGADSMRYGDGLGTLSINLLEQKRGEEAVPYLDESLRICRGRLATANLEDAAYLSNFGWTLRQFRRWEDAEAVYRASLDAWRRLAGLNYHRVGYEAENLASLLAERGRAAEAEPFARLALEVRQHNRADDPAKVRPALDQLITLLEARPGTGSEIDRLLRDEWRAMRRLGPPGSPWVTGATEALADRLHRTGRTAEAEQVRSAGNMAPGPASGG